MLNLFRKSKQGDVEMTNTPDPNDTTLNDMTGISEHPAPTNSPAVVQTGRGNRRAIPGTLPGYSMSMVEDTSPAPTSPFADPSVTSATTPSAQAPPRRRGSRSLAAKPVVGERRVTRSSSLAQMKASGSSGTSGNVGVATSSAQSRPLARESAIIMGKRPRDSGQEDEEDDEDDEDDEEPRYSSAPKSDRKKLRIIEHPEMERVKQELVETRNNLSSAMQLRVALDNELGVARELITMERARVNQVEEQLTHTTQDRDMLAMELGTTKESITTEQARADRAEQELMRLVDQYMKFTDKHEDHLKASAQVQLDLQQQLLVAETNLATLGDEYDESSHDCVEQVGDMTGEIQRQKVRLGEQEIQLNEAKQVAEDLQHRLGEARTKIAELEATADETMEQVETDQTTDHLRHQLTSATAQISTLQATVTQLTTECNESAQAVTDLHARLNEATAGVAALQGTVNQMTMERNQAVQTTSQLQAQLVETTAHAAQLQHIVDQARTGRDQTVDGLQTQLDAANARCDELQAELDEMNTERGLANRALQGMVDQMTIERDQAVQTTSQLQAQLVETTAHAAQLQHIVDQARTGRDQTVDGLQTQLDAANARCDELQAELDEMNTERGLANRALQGMVDQITIERDQAVQTTSQLQAQLVETTAHAAQLQRIVDQARTGRDQTVDGLQTQLDAANARCDVLRAELGEMNTERDLANQRVANFQTRLDQATADTAALQTVVDRTAAELREATDGIEELQVQLEMTTEQTGVLRALANQTAAERDEATETVNHLRARLHTAAADTAALLTQVNQITAERDQTSGGVHDQLNAANARSTELQETIDQRTTQLDHANQTVIDLRARLNAATTETTALQATLHQMTVDRDHARRTATATERMLDQRVADLTNAESTKSEQLNQVQREKDAAHAAWEAAEQARDAASRELQAITMERDEHRKLGETVNTLLSREKRKVEVLEAQIDNLQSDLDAIRTGDHGEACPGNEADNEMEVDDDGLSPIARGKQPVHRQTLLSPSKPPRLPLQDQGLGLKDRIVKPGKPYLASVPTLSASNAYRRDSPFFSSPVRSPPHPSRLLFPASPAQRRSTTPCGPALGLSAGPTTPQPRMFSGPPLPPSLPRAGPSRRPQSSAPEPRTPRPLAPSPLDAKFKSPPTGRRASTREASAIPSTPGEGGEHMPLGPTLERILEELEDLRNRMDDGPGHRRPFRSSRRKTYPFKVPQASRGRGPERNHLMRIVRDTLKVKLGIKTDDQIVNVTDQVMVDPADVLKLATGELYLPPLEPLQIYFDYIPNPWNIQLSWLFADAVLVEHPELDREAVADHFMARIEHLRLVLQRNCARPGEDKEAVLPRLAQERKTYLTRKRRRGRQERLHQIRLDTCRDGGRKDDPAWHLLFNMVSNLGTDGNSSDETDDEVCKVRLQHWRNPEVTRLLEYIDSQRNTTTELGNRLPGNRPHVRRRVQEVTHRQERDIVAHLPGNLYDRTWYAKLDGALQHRLAKTADIMLPIIRDVALDFDNARF